MCKHIGIQTCYMKPPVSAKQWEDGGSCQNYLTIRNQEPCGTLRNFWRWKKGTFFITSNFLHPKLHQIINSYAERRRKKGRHQKQGFDRGARSPKLRTTEQRRCCMNSSRKRTRGCKMFERHAAQLKSVIVIQPLSHPHND